MPYSIKTTNKLIFRRLIITALPIALSAGLLWGPAAFAQQAPAAPVLVKPVPLQQEGLFMAGVSDEGIIDVSYTVKADGTTDDIEIRNGFTNDFYEKTIHDNMAKWTFTPGTVNGEPQDFFNQRHTFKFQVAESLGVSSAVKQELEPIQMLLDQKEYDKASEAIERLLEKETHSVFDYGLLNQMMASAQIGLQNPFGALQYIRQSTMHSLNMAGGKEHILTPPILQTALRQQVMMAATVRAQHEVLSSWKALEEITDVAADDSLRQWLTTAEQQVASPEPLLALGQITDDTWLHTPTHRIFTVADVREGRLDKIVALCERRTLELEYQEGVDWNLPAGFGACELSFHGRNGTLFSIYEFAE